MPFFSYFLKHLESVFVKQIPVTPLYAIWHAIQV